MNALRYLKWRLTHELPASRVLLTVVLMGLFSFSLIHPFLNIVQNLGTRVTPFAYPFVVNNPVTRLAMLCVALVLAVGGCLRQETHILMLRKFGKRGLMGGTILYMLVTILTFQLLVICFSIIWLLPVTTWTLEWGTGWKLLSNPSMSSGFHKVFLPSARLIDRATAMGTFTIALFMDSAMLLLIWLILETCSLRGHSFLGPISSMVILVMDIALYNTFPVAFRKASPVSLTMLNTYYGEMERSSGITIEYGLAFISAVMIFSLLLYFFTVRNIEKRLEESVYS